MILRSPTIFSVLKKNNWILKTSLQKIFSHNCHLDIIFASVFLHNLVWNKSISSSITKKLKSYYMFSTEQMGGTLQDTCMSQSCQIVFHWFTTSKLYHFLISNQIYQTSLKFCFNLSAFIETDQLSGWTFHFRSYSGLWYNKLRLYWHCMPSWDWAERLIWSQHFCSR